MNIHLSIKVTVIFVHWVSYSSVNSKTENEPVTHSPFSMMEYRKNLGSFLLCKWNGMSLPLKFELTGPDHPSTFYGSSLRDLPHSTCKREVG